MWLCRETENIERGDLKLNGAKNQRTVLTAPYRCSLDQAQDKSPFRTWLCLKEHLWDGTGNTS